MLKGTMKIELTDVNTGEKKTVVEHNMVTNALRNIFRPLGLIKYPAYYMNQWAPYYQTLLGGILLFDINLEENANNLFAPASAKLIGCGSYGQQNNTTGTLRGGFNHTESELNLANRYMKYVYDFTTSQANGTISCVCLTHANGGLTSYGSNDAVYNYSIPLGIRIDDGQLQYVNKDQTGAETSDKYSTVTAGTSEYLFAIDRSADIVYYFKIKNSKSISIVKRQAYLQSVSVLENPYKQKAFIEEINLPELQTAVALNYITYNYDLKDNALYIFNCAASYLKPGERFMITKIALGTWDVTQYEMENTSDAQLYTSITRFAFAHDGFVYLKTMYSPFDVYKFEIGNAANVVKINRKGLTGIIGTPQLAYNGRIYFEYYTSYTSGYETLIVNAATNELLKIESYKIIGSSNTPYCYTPMIDDPLHFFMSYGNSSGGGFVLMANYLATINNLSEPVTKTADKTMKITYIVQEQ